MSLSNFDPLPGRWTRIQPIRTISEMDLEFTVFVSDPFRYQQIAERVIKLHGLGMNRAEIARALGEEYKTITRCLKWSKVET